MRLIISENPAKYVALYLSSRLKNLATNQMINLAFPTGSTPLPMYQKLIELNKKNTISFKNVNIFNLDEYVMKNHLSIKNNTQSYKYYMQENFLKKIDIPEENIHLLDGTATDLVQECLSYEEQIRKCGGLDILVCGVGENGHIAFNDPGSSFGSYTRVKSLDATTIKNNSRFFDHDITKTPNQALTIGIKTILDAREVLVIANGLNKSLAIKNAIEGSISIACPITSLQLHRKLIIVCDEFATYELKYKTIKYFQQIKDEWLNY